MPLNLKLSADHTNLQALAQTWANFLQSFQSKAVSQRPHPQNCGKQKSSTGVGAGHHDCCQNVQQIAPEPLQNIQMTHFLLIVQKSNLVRFYVLLTKTWVFHLDFLTTFARVYTFSQRRQHTGLSNANLRLF